ncbi:hypothetical protein G2W53_028233 [Senna tora]|uniref:Uncharacterized protein n=1 Tax=Senna tora TaxID=362788 RepID=A0A834WEJ0_9FABA|nr:hypothetical protein G2W53_028233 [Senna tora]
MKEGSNLLPIIKEIKKLSTINFKETHKQLKPIIPKLQLILAYCTSQMGTIRLFPKSAVIATNQIQRTAITCLPVSKASCLSALKDYRNYGLHCFTIDLTKRCASSTILFVRNVRFRVIKASTPSRMIRREKKKSRQTRLRSEPEVVEWNFRRTEGVEDQQIGATSHWTSCPESCPSTGAGGAPPSHQISAPASLLRSSSFLLLSLRNPNQKPIEPHQQHLPSSGSQNLAPIRLFLNQTDRNLHPETESNASTMRAYKAQWKQRRREKRKNEEASGGELMNKLQRMQAKGCVE